MTDQIYISIGPRPLAGFITLGAGDASDVQWYPGEPLPFPDNSVDAIVHEGFIETLESFQLLPFLAECRRALKQNGIMRTATADLAERVSEYTKSGDASVFNERRHHFDETRLTQLLQRAGFSDAVRRPLGESPHDYLSNLELQPTSGLVLEARKPGRPRVDKAPRVSIIITGAEPGGAIHNALAQSYSKLEVLVVGSTDDGRVQTAASLEEAFQLCTGDLIKVLHSTARLDDGCIARQSAVLRRERNVTLVASHRRHRGPEGKPLKDTRETRRIVGEPSTITGLSAIQSLVQRRSDFIGPPSSAMFRRGDLEDAAIPLLNDGDHIKAWIALLARGDLVYLPESLSSAPRSAGPTATQWQQAQEIAYEAGLWHPNGPYGLWPRPLFPVPWWQQRTTESVKNVLQCLERGDSSAAREAILARADEDAFDPIVALLEAELGQEQFGPEHTIERITALLREQDWYVPAQMRLIQLLSQTGNHAVSDQVLETLHAVVPVIDLGSGFQVDEECWYLEQSSTLHQVGGCVALQLVIGLRRPEHYADRTVVVRAAAEQEILGDWVWQPGVGLEETLVLELTPSRTARSIILEWDVVSEPFEQGEREPLVLTSFDVNQSRPNPKRASA